MKDMVEDRGEEEEREERAASSERHAGTEVVERKKSKYQALASFAPWHRRQPPAQFSHSTVQCLLWKIGTADSEIMP